MLLMFYNSPMHVSYSIQIFIEQQIATLTNTVTSVRHPSRAMAKLVQRISLPMKQEHKVGQDSNSIQEIEGIRSLLQHQRELFHSAV